MIERENTLDAVPIEAEEVNYIFRAEKYN